MARSPPRSRSPDPRRSSHRERGSGYRSPSPGTRYDRSHQSSTRPDDRRSARYQDDRDERRRDARDQDRDHDRRRDDRGVREGRDVRERDRDRDRDRDRERERDRERDRHRERDRDNEKDRDRRRSPEDDRYRRRRDNSDDRHRDSRDDRLAPPRLRSPPPRERERTRTRSPERESVRVIRPPIHMRLSPAGSASPTRSLGPQTEEEKQRIKRERLEAWKKQRELQKQAGKLGSATPEPTPVVDVKPVIQPSGAVGRSGLPAKPTGLGFSLSAPALSRIGLPLKPGTVQAKRTLQTLNHDEDGPERKLAKLDLPDIVPEVQSGEAADQKAIGDDLAAEDVEEEDEKPVVNGNDHVNGDAKPEVKMDVDEEEEEDPLDAFMRENVQEVRKTNVADAKRLGLGVTALEPESEDDEPEIKSKAQEEMEKAEALLQLAASKSRKKDLPPPDHSKIDYEPFRKAFYNPPVEVLEMNEEETEMVRLMMDGIKIRGQDAPRPVRNWGAFGLPSGCLDVIRSKGWEHPTPIQAQAIPAIMSGRDVIGIAKTGSGKTVAFLLPLFRHVKDQRPVGGAEGPIAIVMSPTRELALQIYTECKAFIKPLNIRVACCVGGVTISEDIALMKKGAEIVVCTPGRMIDLLTANGGRVTNVRRTTYMVLDEADRMFDMGFEPQVMKIINNTRPDAQKVLFSATFPKTMESLARRILVRPLEITVGGRSVVAPEVDQRVEVRDSNGKFTRLLEILGELSEENKDQDDVRTLIFVDRQEAADDLFRELLQRGYVCASLHGGKEQVDRDEAIKNFKNGDVPMIVATSVAARGLDVKELKLVVNYDAPNHLEDYVHRAGRTGRAGNKGLCITFISPDQEKFSVDIVRALEASNAIVPKELKEMSNTYLAKIKAGLAKAAGSGFKGKGLERIERRREEKDRTEKHTYGDTSEALSLSSREGAVIPYKPKTTSEWRPPENNHKGETDYTFSEIVVDIVHGPAPDKVFNPLVTGKGKLSLPQQTIQALEKARKEGRTAEAQTLTRVVQKLMASIELTKAEKLGLAAAVDPPKKTKDPDATDWHAIFPINDFPQKARWKATNKEQMTLLAEISGASVTMRGVYYPPGEEPPPGGEPKLHLLIESNDEMKVHAAVEEIRRNIVEASVAALNNADRNIAAGGRYSV
ncbi:pre-mRNA-processing ATP-dependent RNA helicase PRP5 [Tremella mesenterica]|uniref:RNA helicase n=1 Tax=Tremella mesenterica TaxID=5217 RepID=A0A4Q1BKM9_TREME|nr:pre-mRNA-processing ATP-dependent RNA helicase PRP5 [Tremella mesenterica]